MRVGILGGGQLARMLALAAAPLGMRVRVYDPGADVSASAVAEHVRGSWGDTGALARFCEGLDLATVEFENVPVFAARFVAARIPMRPSPHALAATQDRLAEKELARTLGIATARFARVDGAGQLRAALQAVGSPALLKSRRGGYDGRGQALVHDEAGLEEAWAAMGSVPCILESFERFDREVSQIGVRAADGTMAFYPLVENRHEHGILRQTVAPAPAVPGSVRRRAREMVRSVAGALDLVGTIAVEFFLEGTTLTLNEVAPRVHNSGHWTIEGAATSQFENHLRAVAGLPLGPTQARGYSLMRNILGQPPVAARVLGVRGASLHLYDKAAAPGRKTGHVTLCASSPASLSSRDASLLAALSVDEASRAGEPTP